MLNFNYRCKIRVYNENLEYKEGWVPFDILDENNKNKKNAQKDIELTARKQ